MDAAADMDAGTFEELVVALQQMKVVTYFDLSALTLLFYDYLLTLPDELELIWGSRWTITKFVFLLNRYVPFFDTSLGIYHQLGPNVSDSSCAAIYSACGWMIAYGVGISEIILIFRTWAIWGKDKRVGYGLGVLFVVAWVFLSIYLNRFLQSMEFMPLNKILPTFRGCFVTNVDNMLYICFVISLAYETIIVCLTLIKGLQHFRTTNSHLVYSLYRDGVLAYFFLLRTLRVLHAVLTTRIVLNIRRSAQATRVILSSPDGLELEPSRAGSGHLAVRLRM
ncbi:hypothetical protein DENSPDRAFT_839294 [Dentipellis sp. KUC8613]|nr:hypothetical protein DENSPDRAFT_839294 [Dentipellis sp. KUC8613]